jgi:hypothetical protein
MIAGVVAGFLFYFLSLYFAIHDYAWFVWLLLVGWELLEHLVFKHIFTRAIFVGWHEHPFNIVLDLFFGILCFELTWRYLTLFF